MSKYHNHQDLNVGHKCGRGSSIHFRIKVLGIDAKIVLYLFKHMVYLWAKTV
jgi:hypothetical protein